MKIIINRNQLLQAMQHTYIKVSRSVAGAFLWGNHYRMSVQDKNMFVTGTDGNVSITETIQLDEEPTGPVITADAFYVHNSILRAIKALEEQPLELTKEDYQLTIHHSCGYFRVPLSNVTYPEPKSVQPEGAIHILMEAPGLQSQLSKVSFAAADDELRPVMSGVFVEVERNQVNFVSSNGHVLMHLTKACHEPNENTCSFIIPRYVADDILKILPKTGYCDLFYNNNVATLKIEDNLQIDFRCIDGRYPNYKSVIPSEDHYSCVFSVEKKALLKALNRLILFCGHSTKSVHFAIDNPGLNIIKLSTKDIDEDTVGQEKLTCEFEQGIEKFGRGILFRIPFLLKILNKIPADKVTFHTTGSASACIITFEPLADIEKLTALVMPMLLSDDD